MLLWHAREALSNLWCSKLRTSLAVLGILIGTASVVAMVSCGKIATNEALKQFKVLGTDLMSVSLRADGEEGRKVLRQLNTSSLQQALTLPSIQHLAPYASFYTKLYAKGQSVDGFVIGVSEQLADIIKIAVAKGRFISELDHYEQFCVVGATLYEQIKQKTGQEEALYQTLRIGDDLFTIIGVLERWPQNSFFYQNINRSVMVSIPVAKELSKYTVIRDIVFRLQADAKIKSTEQAIRTALQELVPSAKFIFRSAEQIIQSMQKQSDTFTLLLGVIGGISLLVGGIGVMNIMLVSVVERRREIGVRKALGAKRAEIRHLFLIESTILSLTGGLCGVLLGVLISYVIASYAHWSFELFWSPVLVGFSVSCAVGIFFGFYPAHTAAKADPIACLHTD